MPGKWSRNWKTQVGRADVVRCRLSFHGYPPVNIEKTWTNMAIDTVDLPKSFSIVMLVYQRVIAVWSVQTWSLKRWISCILRANQLWNEQQIFDKLLSRFGTLHCKWTSLWKIHGFLREMISRLVDVHGFTYGFSIPIQSTQSIQYNIYIYIYSDGQLLRTSFGKNLKIVAAGMF